MTSTFRSRVAVVIALAVIALVTLPPSGAATYGRVDLCLVCGQNGAASGLLNVVLYVPLGVALWWATGRLASVILLGALVSFSVEALQLFIPGRHTALSDLLANTLGAASGGLLAIRPRAWILPSGRWGHLAAAFATAGAALMLVLTGVLMRPVAPGGDYYGQWEPRGARGRVHDGQVLEARIGDMPLPQAQLDAARVQALIRQRAPVHVRFIVGSRTSLLMPVFRLVGGTFDDGTEALQVGVDGDALVLTPRFLADDFRLSRPEVQLEHALAAVSSSDTIRLTLQARPDHGFDVQLGDEPPHLVGFTVGRSWALLYATWLRSERTLRLMDHAWLAALGALVGWFARGRAAQGAALVTCLAAATLTPRWSHLLPTPITLLLVLTAGMAAGVMLRRGAERLSAASASRAPAAGRRGSVPTPPRSPRSR